MEHYCGSAFWQHLSDFKIIYTLIPWNHFTVIGYYIFKLSDSWLEVVFILILDCWKYWVPGAFELEDGIPLGIENKYDSLIN